MVWGGGDIVAGGSFEGGGVVPVERGCEKTF